MNVFSRKSKQPVRRRRSDASKQSIESPVSFRRNRTLVGSRSQEVEAAGSEKHTQLLSPRAQAHQLAKKRRRMGGMFAGMLTVAAILGVLMFQFTASSHVTSTTETQLDSSRYEAAIDEYLRKNPAERLRITLDEQRLLKYIEQRHPEVLAIESTGTAGFGKSGFTLEVRRPIAAWQIDDAQYFVDADGVAFKKNYYDTPQVRIVDESALERPSDAATVASTRFLSFVGRAAAYAESAGIAIDTATIPWGTTRQLEFRFAGRDFPVRVSLDRPVGEQFEDAIRSMEYLDSKKVTPEYVDVRVSGKAFYK